MECSSPCLLSQRVLTERGQSGCIWMPHEPQQSERPVMARVGRRQRRGQRLGLPLFSRAGAGVPCTQGVTDPNWSQKHALRRDWVWKGLVSSVGSYRKREGREAGRRLSHEGA